MAHGEKTLTTDPATATDSGEVMAAVSVYDVVDGHKDRIKQGGWDDFAERVNAGEVVAPIVWQHEIADPDLYLGETIKLDPRGANRKGQAALVLTGQLDMDHPKAARAHKLLKAGRVRQWSFFWEGTAQYDTETGIRDLSEMSAHEFSPVLVGANRDTDTLRVKSGLALPADCVEWTDANGVKWVKATPDAAAKDDDQDDDEDQAVRPKSAMVVVGIDTTLALALGG